MPFMLMIDLFFLQFVAESRKHFSQRKRKRIVYPLEPVTDSLLSIPLEKNIIHILPPFVNFCRSDWKIDLKK
jgi:hypothetical protein